MRIRAAMWLSTVLFILTLLSTLHFGYKYYWWIYYPLRHHGGPELTVFDERLWTYGLWVSGVVTVLSWVTLAALIVRNHRTSGLWIHELGSTALIAIVFAVTSVVLLVLNHRTNGLWCSRSRCLSVTRAPSMAERLRCKSTTVVSPVSPIMRTTV